MSMTNILILSCGTRNKIVQYFRRALADEGRVVAADCSELAPALYDADRYYIVPRMSEDGYIEVILDICMKEKISGVLSLIDPELSLLAGNADRFIAIGTTVVGSGYDICELCLDKYRMYQWLKEHGYHCARTWVEKEEFYGAADAGEVVYPVFVKPRDGSASMRITEAEDRRAVEFFMNRSDGLIIQEFMHGQEIGADVYIDMISGEVTSIFTKKKIKMRAGETDKAVSFKDKRLFELIERFVGDAGFKGQIDIDIFDVDGEYYISEVNPRFGGGYPHAYESGCDHMKLIVENLSGRTNAKNIGNYKENVYMMKYNEIKMVL